MIRIGFILAVMCFARLAYSQGTLAPLYLLTNGDGTITPYQSGDLLEAGQTYTITAVPDPGYEFYSWQEVDFFTTTQTNFDQYGNPILPPVQSLISSLRPDNIYGADLEFTMQASMMVASGNPNIVQNEGWQANFIAVPEPGEVAIAGCGLVALVAARRRKNF